MTTQADVTTAWNNVKSAWNNTMSPALDALVNAIIDQNAISGGKKLQPWVAQSIVQLKIDTLNRVNDIQNAVNNSVPQ